MDGSNEWLEPVSDADYMCCGVAGRQDIAIYLARIVDFHFAISYNVNDNI